MPLSPVAPPIRSPHRSFVSSGVSSDAIARACTAADPREGPRVVQLHAPHPHRVHLAHRGLRRRRHCPGADCSLLTPSHEHTACRLLLYPCSALRLRRRLSVVTNAGSAVRSVSPPAVRDGPCAPPNDPHDRRRPRRLGAPGRVQRQGAQGHAQGCQGAHCARFILWRRPHPLRAPLAPDSCR